MAKQKNNDLLATVAAVFCFFITFLHLLSLLSAFRFSSLLLPSLWLLLGLCLLTQKKNWLCVVAMLPLTVLIMLGAFTPLPTDSVGEWIKAVICNVLQPLGLAVTWVLLLLACIGNTTKVRRKLWLFPILLALPACILQSGATLPWAQFGVIVCMSIWLKPSAK